MRVRLLGAVKAEHDGVALALGGLKQRAVFALLALEVGRVVGMDRLVLEVWPDEPPPQATVALRAYVSRLRRVLVGTGAVIETVPPGWSLRLPAGVVDAAELARLVEEGRHHAESGDPGRTREVLEQALGLWSGEPLADLATLELAQVEAVRLGALRQEARELLLEARLALGDGAGVVEAARRLVDADPYRERAWCALMLALYRDGRQSEAVAAYGRLRRLLREELGLDPSPRVRELEARILRQDPGLEAPAPVPTPTPSAASAPEPADGPGSGLTGRDDVLAGLDRAWRRAGEGSGSLVLLEASAGAGKSAVLQAVAARARATGGRTLEGHGIGDDAPALWPWMTLVRNLLEQLPAVGTGGAPSGPAALALATLGGGTAAPVAAEDLQLAQTRLYRGVVDLLLAARRLGPVAVLLDDLQWFDRDSLTLLALVVDQVVPAGVLLVVAARAEEVDDALVRRLLGAAPPGRVERPGLPALEAGDVAALGARIAGRPLEPGLVATVAERSAGNPLFVTELVRLLVAEGRLTEQAAREALPAGVRDVLQRRVERLPEATVGLLGVAALVGPVVLDVELLAAVTGRAEEEVLDGCEAGLLSGLLVEGERPGTFGLSHDLVRQTLAGGLSEARRVRLHAKVAAALQARTTTSPEQVVETARQLTLAAPAVGAAAALPYLVSVSEDALSRYAHESAEATLREAQSVAAAIADPVERRAAQAQVNGLLDGLTTLVRAVLPEIAVPGDGVAFPPRPTDARSTAGWLGTVTAVTISGRYRWGREAAREVLADDPTPSAEIAARFVLGWLGFALGDLEAAADELGVLDAMVGRGVDISLPGALSRLPESVAGYGALVAHCRGQDERASELLARGRERAAGSGSGLLDLSLYAALLAAMRGDRAEAAERAAECARRSLAAEFPVYAIVSGVVAGWSQVLAGAPVERVDAAWATCAATGIRTYTPTFLLLRAEAHATAGDVDGAVALVREARRTTLRNGEVCCAPRLVAVADRLLAAAATG